MLRRLHLILAALAILFAPLAMQSGMVMAGMPMDHGEMAQAGHCGEKDTGDQDEPGAMLQCCVAMCSAVAPLGAATIGQIIYDSPILSGFQSSEHRSFRAKLPTPPPRLA